MLNSRQLDGLSLRYRYGELSCVILVIVVLYYNADCGGGKLSVRKRVVSWKSRPVRSGTYRKFHVFVAKTE